MKKSTVVVLLIALTLAACAHRHDAHSQQSQNPVVKIDGATARINPSVLVFKSDPAARPITITWRLDPASGFRFAERGIEIEGEIIDQIVRGNPPSVVLDTRQNVIGSCKAADEKQLSYSCTNSLARPGVFKYTIRVTDGKQQIVHDPVIANW